MPRVWEPVRARDDDGPPGPGSRFRRVVLFVDDDVDFLEICARMIENEEVAVLTATRVDEALGCITTRQVDAVIVDLNLPGRSGLELIATLRAQGNPVPTLVLTGAPSVAAAVDALKLGAVDFLVKPVDAMRLRHAVTELVGAPVRQPTDEGGWFEGILGRSQAMRAVFSAVERVAATDAAVLVVGESGTGKELVARAIQARSSRRAGAFVPVHTGAIPRDLVASEMFGHERGAFTGATAAADGKFAAAAGGTIFLDEIGTMVLDVQVVLLRVLETMRFTRIGGRREQIADVRVIAATNRDLLTLVDEGRFREDLYFRLAVFTIVLPPLRERVEDIEPLAAHFLQQFARRHASVARRFSADAIAALEAHAWPGNVRELRNVVERAAVFATSAEVVSAELRLETARGADSSGRFGAASPLAPEAPRASNRSGTYDIQLPATGARERVEGPSIVIPLGASLEDAERALIVATLEHVGGNKVRAAQVLRISRRCLYNRLRQYGLHGARDHEPRSILEPSDDELSLAADDPSDPPL